MKRLFLVLGILLFLITTPVLASKDKEKDKDRSNRFEISEKCDINNSWKNHGGYVSCVAKLRLGGASVSAAARSDVGSPTPSPTGIGTTNSASQITIEGTKIEIKALIAVLQKIIESLKHLL